jgi:hypothetical protein
MTTIAAFSFLFGAIFGLRFKVLVLIPIITLGVILATIMAIASAIAGIARASDWWTLALSVIAASTALQLGYLAGTAAMAFIFFPKDSQTKMLNSTHRLGPTSI